MDVQTQAGANGFFAEDRLLLGAFRDAAVASVLGLRARKLERGDEVASGVANADESEVVAHPLTLYLPFVRALPSRIRFLFVLAAVIYVGGALGVERATDWYDVNNQLDTLEYNIWAMVEEAMEMAGVIVFIHALLVLKATTRRCAICFPSRGERLDWIR